MATMRRPRKAVQIIACQIKEIDRLAALCNDGTIWISDALADDGWLKVVPIPQPERKK